MIQDLANTVSVPACAVTYAVTRLDHRREQCWLVADGDTALRWAAAPHALISCYPLVRENKVDMPAGPLVEVSCGHRDGTRLCQAVETQLYPAGWRCAAHAPAGVVGRGKPGSAI